MRCSRAPTVTLTPKSARDLPTNTPVPRTYDPDPIELPDDATWLLEYLDGRPVIAATFITLRLRGDMLEGVDGCNSFASQPGDGTIIARSDGSFSTPKEIVLTLKDVGGEERCPPHPVGGMEEGILTAGGHGCCGERRGSNGIRLRGHRSRPESNSPTIPKAIHTAASSGTTAFLFLTKSPSPLSIRLYMFSRAS